MRGANASLFGDSVFVTMRPTRDVPIRTTHTGRDHDDDGPQVRMASHSTCGEHRAEALMGGQLDLLGSPAAASTGADETPPNLDGVCVQSHDAAATTRVAAPESPLRARVLVAEDQPVNREVAQCTLEALGIGSDTASNGQEALAKLARERFEAVLMDCEMPVMDGFATTRALREGECTGGGRRLPVIALTADETAQQRAACLDAGMDDYVAKPFTREALRAVLARWLPAAGTGVPAAATAFAIAMPAGAGAVARSDPPAGLLLDRATLDALRALPERGARDMLSHIADSWLADSQQLLARIERAAAVGDAAEMARAAHAWRSCNGHVGAFALMSVCRELEQSARAGDLSGAPALLAQAQRLYERVSRELQGEIRRSA